MLPRRRLALIRPGMLGCRHPGAWRGLTHVFVALAPASGTVPHLLVAQR